MKLHDRLGSLARPASRTTPVQPTPRLRSRPAPAHEGVVGCHDQPAPTPTDHDSQDTSLVHLLDLRHRYRDEAIDMRQRLIGLQAALEDSSRQLWYAVTAGQAPSPELRLRCDDLVLAVEELERDLADVHLAIEGVGQEITQLVAVRQRCGRR